MVYPNGSSPPRQTSLIPNYNRHLVKDREINDGRTILYHKVQASYLQDTFKIMKWESFLNQDFAIFPRHVKEFYANFSYNRLTQVICVNMYGHPFTWSLEQFGRLLEIPHHGIEFYSSSYSLGEAKGVDPQRIIDYICTSNTTLLNLDHGIIQTFQLKPELRMWYKVINTNVFCKIGNHFKVHACEAYLLYHFVTQQDVNLAHLLAMRMSNLGAQPNRFLPYGMLLTKLFLKIKHLPHVEYRLCHRAPLDLTMIDHYFVQDISQPSSPFTFNEQDEIDSCESKNTSTRTLSLPSLSTQHETSNLRFRVVCLEEQVLDLSQTVERLQRTIFSPSSSHHGDS